MRKVSVTCSSSSSSSSGPAHPMGTRAGGLGPSISSNRSFKKHINNAQGGAKASVATVNTKDSSIASAQHDVVQNGARVHPQLHGGSDTPIASTLPGQLKLQPFRKAPELFQRLRLLREAPELFQGFQRL